jgi:hypothetical protein
MVNESTITCRSCGTAATVMMLANACVVVYTYG